MVVISGADRLRLVFFGTPPFALPSLGRLLATRHQVIGVVTQPDRPRGRGQRVSDSPVKIFALEHGLPVLQPERLQDPGVTAALAAWSPDLGVVSAYGRIIPAALLAVPRLGMINVHASLLPRYRGAAPIQRAVMDGARETGVTIQRVTPALDAGDMLGVVRRPIGPDETSVEVERGLAEIGAGLLADVVEQIAAGTARGEPQDHARATYAPRLTRDDGLIDWSLPAAAIHDRVRGLHPWPHAHTYLDGARIIVLKTHEEPGPARPPAPGTVVSASRDAFAVAAGDGRVIVIDLLQPEGRRAMTARDFLASRSVSAGSRFTAAAAPGP